MDDIIFRVGEGRTSSGKILDRGTKWFNEADKALDCHMKTGKPVYVSVNRRAYVKLSEERLRSYIKCSGSSH